MSPDSLRDVSLGFAQLLKEVAVAENLPPLEGLKHIPKFQRERDFCATIL
jgi:hypothetical protein